MRTLVLATILLLARPSTGVPETSPPAEVARLRWHLATVEAALRTTDVSALTPAQRAARARNLDVLHKYWVRGVFPVNTDFPGRHVPYFIDRFGTRCAMAYLIEQSGSGDLVRRVAATANNAYVRDLQDDAELRAWLRENGLTAAEAARIQPTYGTPSDDFAGRWDGTVSFGSSGTRLRFILTNEGGDGWMLTFPTAGSYMPREVTLDGDSLVLEAAPAPRLLGTTELATRMSTVLHYRGNTLTGSMDLYYASGAVVRGTASATLECEGHDSPETVAAFARALKLPMVRCMTEIGAGAVPGGEWSVHSVIHRNVGGQWRYAFRTALLWRGRVGWIVDDQVSDSSSPGMFRARPNDQALTSRAFLRGMTALGLRLRWAKTLLRDPDMPRFVPAALIATLHDTLDVPLAGLLVSSPAVTRDPELLVALAHLPVAPDSVWRRNDGGLVYESATSGYAHARGTADQLLWSQSLALIAAPGTSRDVLLTIATWRDRHLFGCPGRPDMREVVPALKERATRERDTAILEALGKDPYRPRAPEARWIC